MGYRNSLVFPGQSTQSRPQVSKSLSNLPQKSPVSAFAARLANEQQFLTSYKFSFMNCSTRLARTRAQALPEVSQLMRGHRMSQSKPELSTLGDLGEKSESFGRSSLKLEHENRSMAMGQSVNFLRSPAQSPANKVDRSIMKEHSRAVMELLADPDLECRVRGIFEKQDKNLDGKLVFSDVIAVLRSLHRQLGLPNPDSDSHEDAERMFKKYDTQNRQELDFREFFDLILALLRRCCFERSKLVGREFFVTKHEGSVWDRYERGKKLGEGSFGTAFKAKQRYTKEDRVVKVVKKARVQIPVEDVEREIIVMRQVDHPHVVRLRRWYEDKQRIYLVMDYLRGGTLRAVVLEYQAKGQGLKENWTRSVTQQVLNGMAYCHSLRLIHKDLKDENIMLLKKDSTSFDEPFAIIIDLGISEMFSNSDPQGRECGGTPTTMAPEVWQGNFGPKCDVWSLGCVVFEMLTGKLPFQAKSLKPQAWIKLHQRGPNFALVRTSGASRSACQAMLTFEEDKRPTMQQCLEHEWFTVEKRELKTVGPAEFQSLQAFCKESAIKRSLLMEIASRLPMDDAGHVVEVFESFDENNDGRISLQELQLAFKHLGLQDAGLAAKTFKVLDLDGDGQLSFTEFCSLVLVLFKDLLYDRVDKLLSEYDKHGKGSLDREGAEQFMTEVGRIMKKDSRSRSSNIMDGLLQDNRPISLKDFRDKLLGNGGTPGRCTPLPKESPGRISNSGDRPKALDADLQSLVITPMRSPSAPGLRNRPCA